ncbi:MAG: caspase family protein [Candidatus Aminicenantes bacterium]|nr:MAG: caspase family protein [Candidatus Aminicenantes bacterium]
MRSKQILSFVLILFILNSINIFAAQNKDKVVTKRFAIAVGTNKGGKDRVKLKYAVTDAESVLEVFEELGGVSEEDSLLLVEPDVKTFYTEIGKFQAKIERAKSEYSRVEVIFYYSGHSDEDYILLGDEKISYKDFRETINNTAADVRIAILDSCASGAFTRLKGGKKRLPFLLDTAYDTKGYAVMTSSSSTEASQESDLIKSSFFTHYLISGMRGAADMTRDGRVTFNEAYQFAFNETLAETTKTLSGPQHPHYNIQTSGTGDVVMTDIRRSSAVLILSEGISGKIFIHDKNDVLVVELTKLLDQTIELGLEEGEYRIINIPETQVFEFRVNLQKEMNFELSNDLFEKTDVKYTTPRGDRYIKVQRETILRGKSRITLFVELVTKTTSMHGGAGVLMGANFGLTFNNALSFGVGGYGKSNFGGGGPGLPGYGGLFFAYTFSPQKKTHFRVLVLAGSGTAKNGNIFYVFEPGVEMVVNLSKVVRLQFGLSLPIDDREDTGLGNPIFSAGFQFGK